MRFVPTALAGAVMRAGLVHACVGDEGPLVYKRSRRDDTHVDAAAAHVLETLDPANEVVDFSPYATNQSLEH